MEMNSIKGSSPYKPSSRCAPSVLTPISSSFLLKVARCASDAFAGNGSVSRNPFGYLLLSDDGVLF